MDERLQLRVQRYGWDRAASAYEASWQAPLDLARHSLLERLRPRPGERVLDVACGTGVLARELARLVGTTGEVVGIDLSQAMIDAANGRERDPASAPTHHARMDAQSLAFPDASFDVVLCCFGLMYLPDAERALAEMRRVLRPGGRVGLAVWGERMRCAWAPVFSIVDAEVASEVCPLFFRLGAPDALARACRDAGLAVAWQSRLVNPLRYPDADAACAAMFLAGPVALAWTRFDEDVRARVRGRYLGAIAPWRDGAGYALPAEFACLEAIIGDDLHPAAP
ncbi:MAG: methyltransferase domain-containing protein [Caulobacter sp.]|nr:methyltransferase domain-containing protein [Vitreoscilla sp.]